MRRCSLRLPTTNVYAKGGYSVTIHLGSERDQAQLILDTGSSSLVVSKNAYKASQDQSLQTTPYAQNVNYAMGSWYGCVVKTEVDFYSCDLNMQLANGYVAVANTTQAQCFADADGILGLAYHELNKARDFSQYFERINYQGETGNSDAIFDGTENRKQNEKEAEKQSHHVTATYPWLNQQRQALDQKAFKQLLKNQPKTDLKPYFTQLEQQGVAANEFSFLNYRSSIHHHKSDLSPQQLAADPLNQGLFILGGGEQDTDLYQGELTAIKVVDDVYYNVRLLQVKVPGFEAFDAPKLQGKKLQKHHSNAFFDTGASVLVLDNVVYDYIIDCFEKINPEFKKILLPFLSFEGVEEGIDANLIDLNDWPTIEFIFVAADSSAETSDCADSHKSEQQVSLFCRPEEYWQINAPEHGQAAFKILSQLPGWPDQSILGLPLLSNYYVIFARSEGQFGSVKFAKAKKSAVTQNQVCPVDFEQADPNQTGRNQATPVQTAPNRTSRTIHSTGSSATAAKD